MPGGSGIDVLKRLKVSEKTKHIPVLVVSGSAGTDIRDFVKRLGAADLLEKPLDHEQFCNAVAGLMVPTLEHPASSKQVTAGQGLLSFARLR